MPEGPTAHALTSKEQKRNRILKAAIEVFAEKGYFTARMTDVASAAHVADGTLYLYFDGKEDLLMTIFDQILSQFIERLEHEIQTLDDPADKLRLMVRLHLETLGRNRSLAHVLQIETRHTRKFMSQLTRGKLGKYLGLVRTIIEEGQATGRFRSGISAGLATNVVFGAVDELVMSWLLAEEPGDLLRYLDPLMELLIGGLAPCGPTP
ncbi:MAG: TetR/AcrR family transcriptional regulator [Acidobacteria bacterium]|nr:TetR/AcrR family transcriptional regulator [Acidobacteriota bacterium]